MSAMAKTRSKAQTFKSEVQRKIQTMLQEFAEGKISQAQFDVIYDHYHSQLLLAEYAVEHASATAVEIAQSGPSTLSLKEASQGKAVGLTIYHLRSGGMIENLGNFEVPTEIIVPIFNDLSRSVSDGEPVKRHVQKIGDRRWLLCTTGKFTVVVTLFHNEPSFVQTREMERLHRDFEDANHLLLAAGRVDVSRLAFPFVVFIQKKLGT